MVNVDEFDHDNILPGNKERKNHPLDNNRTYEDTIMLWHPRYITDLQGNL